ncbi:hypothetical protein [Acinetobacter bereziniae]|uniref:hypothetical protein n=1 Tax=Acinetobacter bereziniae TaxID=106648 RepID=UPI0019013A4E|nr:hypothetical protein [Acinetobacter bereziniae]MBJ8426063.1 hypothetical protein [Acinetobacter bereziniae]MBJ9902026.1 hypothetical protein [Acinetobacter bereziniae]
MDLIIRFLVWVVNCFLSGKAQALGFALFGTVISYVLVKIAPIVFSAAYFIYPELKQYIFEHLLIANLIMFIVFMTPFSIGSFVAFQKLKFIYYKENFRHF